MLTLSHTPPCSHQLNRCTIIGEVNNWGRNQEVELVSKVCLTKISPPPSAIRGLPAWRLWLTNAVVVKAATEAKWRIVLWQQRWGWEMGLTIGDHDMIFPTTGGSNQLATTESEMRKSSRRQLSWGCAR
jgi:hypothetical protein